MSGGIVDVHPLIERAARVQARIELGDGDMELIEAFWPRFAESANAVVLDLLAALEEPSMKMLDAPNLAGEGIISIKCSLIVWRAMLAALRTEITAQGGS